MSDDPTQSYLTYQPEELKAAAAAAAQAGDNDTAQMLRTAYFSHKAAQNPTNYNPTTGMSPGELGLAGIGRGFVHPVKSVGNLFGLNSDQSLQQSNALDASLMATPEGRAGNLIGEIGLTAPLGLGATGLLGRAGSIGARLASNPISRSAFEGGLQGGVTADPGSRGLNTLLGAGTGGLFGLAGKGLSAGIRGVSRTPAAQTLLDKGVDLTPGLMNPQGFGNWIEDSAEHVPFGSSIMHPPREAARQGLQRAFIEEGAMPGTKIADGTPAAMLEQAAKSYDPLYQSARGFPMAGARVMSESGAEPILDKLFAKSANLPGTSASVASKENAWLQEQYQATLGKARADGGLTSDHLLDLRSDIRARQRQFGIKSDSQSQEISDIHKSAQKQVTKVLESQLPDEPLANLKYADANYGKYKVVEKAIANSGDNVAGLTPEKVSAAIKQSVEQGDYAHNQVGNLQGLRDLAQAGHQVFQKQPLTGTRVAALMPIGAAMGLAPHGMVAGGAALTGAALGAATQTGRRLAQGITKPQLLAQKLISAGQRALPPGVAPAIGQIGRTAGVQSTLPLAQALLAGRNQ